MFSTRKESFTGVSKGYQISNSVRMRNSSSAQFAKTFAANGNRTTWTMSFWMKMGNISQGFLMCAGVGTGQGNDVERFYFDSGNGIYWQRAIIQTSTTYQLQTNARFKDPSAWYHVVIVWDSNNATAADRWLVYVNGTRMTLSTQSTVSSGQTSLFNSTSSWKINRGDDTSSSFGDNYLAEMNFIDGQALTPSSFGETNSVTGVWQPKKYTGTYGTNGFYMNFSDNSAATATTIGKDSSGNGNNWTPTNISVTAGVTYDSMLDTPTPYADGENGRGNYAVLNPLFTSGKAQETITYSQGNLVITSGTTGFWIGTGSSLSFGMSGSFYAELLLATGTFQGHAFGVVDATNNAVLAARSGASPYSGICINHQGAVYKNGVNVANVAATTNGDVISIAFDGPNSQVIFKKNNATWYTVTGIPSVDQYAFFGYISDGSSQTWNFGQRPFTYTPPTGFNALNTQNLPNPTILNGAAYMAATLYTGNGSTQSITNTVNGVSFQPDFVWIKVRSASATDHYLADAVRGATKFLQSDTTAAEGTNNGLTAFNSNGFSVGAIGDTNTNTATLVGWQWNAGGSTVTNTDGSISAQVRANATAGFSVVTWTGTGAVGTIGHGLGVAPSFVIVKYRTGTAPNIAGWGCYHRSLTSAAYRIDLNSTSAQISDTNAWNSTAPTSSVVTIGTNLSVASTTMVAYCFAAVAGYSAFGSYVGTSTSDGTFVYLGFRPRWIMIKNTTIGTAGQSDWVIYDTSRGTYNVVPMYLLTNLSNAEATSGGNEYIDILSNGFKLRGSSNYTNSSSYTYIYAAFAENPFKNSLAR